ncbi:MAG: hypothetical protein ABI367_01520 [Mucilaginibacter sp.]
MFALLLLCFISFNKATAQASFQGHQPQVAKDASGVVRLVYGRADSIFCSTSTDAGKTFSKPILVGIVPDMHLGMARGPQLASSVTYSLVTAIDKKGEIHYFILNHRTRQGWKAMGFLNDQRSSAPEGLMNIASDKQDHFYAVWLDTRMGKKNNIYFSSFTPKSNKWSLNKLAYQSPDGHVCECCRPSIAVDGSRVAIMFRNWLMGSRDLYLIRSENNGITFSAAQKLGAGTWKLNACPMDGGGLIFNTDHSISTIWKRQGTVYYAKPGSNEVELATGRDCSISLIGGQNVVSFSDNGNLKITYVGTNKVTDVGKGSYLKTIGLPENKLLLVWEDGEQVKAKTL